MLHCPRTLGETFKRKVEHFNTLQKVLAIPGGKFTPLINGQSLIFILSLSAEWVDSCLACWEAEAYQIDSFLENCSPHPQT